MTAAAEIGVVCAAALVAASLVAIAIGRGKERFLLAIAATLGAGALACLAGLAISLGRSDGNWRTFAVTFAAILALALAQVGLAALNRLRARDARLTATVEQGHTHIDERIESHARQRARELEHTLARERARSQHELVEQERELAEARSAAIANAEQTASDELLRRIASSQDALTARVSGWSADLTRAQAEQAQRIEDAERVQRATLTAQRAELDEHQRALHDLGREQQSHLEELKTEFSDSVSTLGETLHRELEVEEQHFRREIAQLSDRLKAVSHSLREDAYREELDARARLSADIGGAERRVVASFEKTLERAADRVAEEAERRFDAQIRESREETAGRLSAELERTRDAYGHQIEDEIEGRLHEVAKQTTQRLQRQLDQVVRQAETQTSSAEDRITFITQRLETAIDTAAGRVAAFEAELELELTTKLAEFERAVRHAEQRAVRHAEQSVGRETG